MNFLLRMYNDTVDIANNPYFEFKAYVLDDNVNYYARETEELKFEKCPGSEIGKYMGDHNVPFNKNVYCFKNLSQHSLTSTWYGKEFRNIVISIEKCKKNCASDEETDEFFRGSPIILYNGIVDFDSRIYYDDDNIENYQDS